MPRTKSKPVHNRQQLRLLRQRLAALLRELAAADPGAPTTRSLHTDVRPASPPTPPAGNATTGCHSGRIEHLDQWCARHLDFLRPTYGHVHAERFFDSTRVVEHVSGPLHLFKRYDPLLGQDVLEWHPQLFALAKVVQSSQNHVEGCTGFVGPAEADGFLGRLMMRCGCPTVFGEMGYEWVVEPKNASPLYNSVIVKHRQIYTP